MDQFIISQVLAGLAWLIELISFQFKAKNKILSCLILSSFCIMGHFFLLEKTTAGALMIVIIIRLFVAQKTTNKFVLWSFLLLTALITFFTYNNFYDLIPFVAVTFLTIGVFQKNDRRMRLWMMPGTLTFIIYNIIIGSPMMTFTETSFLITNLVGYWRYYLRKT